MDNFENLYATSDARPATTKPLTSRANKALSEAHAATKERRKIPIFTRDIERRSNTTDLFKTILGAALPKRKPSKLVSLSY